MKNDKLYPHLTKTKTGYVLPAHVKTSIAADVSRALQQEQARTNKSIAAIVCAAVVGWCGENEAQRRIEYALAILDRYGELVDRSPGQREIIMDMRMILTWCEMSTTTVFTGKKSQEYIERYGDAG